MPTNNSGNIKYTKNADGYTLTGGTTARALSVTGGDVQLIGSGSATITFPANTGTIYASGNTDVALADGGTGSSLTDPNADRLMFWDDSAGAVDWLTLGTNLSITGTTINATGGGGGGSTIQPYDYIIYISSGTTYAYKTSDGSTLTSSANASVPIQAAIDAIDASSATGGRIYIMPGTYALTTKLTIQGDNTTDSKGVSLHGAGVQSVILKPSVNVDCISLENRAKVSLKDFAVICRGTGNGITSSNSSTGQRAFWQSEFKNIFIYDDGTSTAHTGWGMDLGNAFRSVFENIEMLSVGNGVRFRSLDTSGTNYNPGDFTWTRSFIELNTNTGGVAYQIGSVASGTGTMNQMLFSMCEAIGGGTGQVGIQFLGNGAAHTRWNGLNMEQFDTILDIQGGNSNEFEFNYIVTRDAASTTYFKTSSFAFNNKVLKCGFLDTYAQTATIVNDANTNASLPNEFRNIRIQGESTGETFTVTNATIMYNIYDNGFGGNSKYRHTDHRKGNNVASATTVTLGYDGNFFIITGTTTIAGIVTTGWPAGSEVTLQFSGALTLTHNSGAPGTNAVAFLLNGATNMTTAANNVVTFIYNGTNWIEKCRKV